METKEFQKMCANIVSQIDKKHNIKRDVKFCFCQLIEEIGELAKEINSQKLRDKSLDKLNLSREFADVIMLLVKLADMYDIDLEKAVNEKVNVLKKRGYL
jgi:NTP pyrophosphatase (non-canonical NTP hydrolase)